MMNIRKFFKVRNYYLLLGVIMINVGCTKNFLEYNTNPNEATDEMTDQDNVRTGSLLLQMEQNVLVCFPDTFSRILDNVDQYLLKQGSIHHHFGILFT